MDVIIVAQYRQYNSQKGGQKLGVTPFPAVRYSRQQMSHWLSLSALLLRRAVVKRLWTLPCRERFDVLWENPDPVINVR